MRIPSTTCETTELPKNPRSGRPSLKTVEIPTPAHTVQLACRQPTQAQEFSEGPGGPFPVHSLKSLMVFSTDRRYCARIAASSSALSRGPWSCTLAGPAPGGVVSGWLNNDLRRLGFVLFLIGAGRNHIRLGVHFLGGRRRFGTLGFGG